MPVSTAYANGRQVAPSAAPSNPQVRRAAELRRGFQRQLGRKPSTIQRALMHRAALSTAIAEAAWLDPAVSWDDKVRLDHAAERARVEWSAAIARPDAVPSLQELLAGVK